MTTPRDFDCPTCGAAVGAPCRFPNGKPRRYQGAHQARVGLAIGSAPAADFGRIAPAGPRYLKPDRW